MNLSICMIVKNEEHMLLQALDSLPDKCEIIVVDTGSTDRTIEIARRYGASVYEFEWNNSFSDARNYAISKANAEYVLMLDADEMLDGEFAEQFKQYRQAYANQPGAVIIQNENDDESTRHRAVRIFPRSLVYRYEGVVHEQIHDGNGPVGGANCEILIYHYGYRSEIYASKNKFEKYLTIYNEVLKHNPRDGYMQYQLGKLYYSNGNYYEAYQAFGASADIQEADRYYFPVMLVQLGNTLKRLGQSRAALELLEPFLPVYPTYADLPFLLGTLCMDTGDLEGIEYFFKTALEIGETSTYTTVVGTGTYRAAHNLAVFYEVTGNMKLAQHYYSFAAGFGFEPSAERMKILNLI